MPKLVQHILEENVAHVIDELFVHHTEVRRNDGNGSV